MQLNWLFHALWLLCALGTTVFATASTRAWVTVPALMLGFFASVVWIRPDRLPDAVWVGGLVAVVAVLQLLRPGRVDVVTTICGGVLAGLWGSLLRIEGLPWVPALVIGAALPTISASLTARRSTFAPAALREEALLIVFGLGVTLAMVPNVLQGWRSAVALNLTDKSGSHELVPMWTLSFIGTALALGGVYAFWRRS